MSTFRTRTTYLAFCGMISIGLWTQCRGAEECLRHSDCASGLTCADGRCTPSLDAADGSTLGDGAQPGSNDAATLDALNDSAGLDGAIGDSDAASDGADGSDGGEVADSSPDAPDSD